MKTTLANEPKIVFSERFRRKSKPLHSADSKALRVDEKLQTQSSSHSEEEESSYHVIWEIQLWKLDEPRPVLVKDKDGGYVVQSNEADASEYAPLKPLRQKDFVVEEADQILVQIGKRISNSFMKNINNWKPPTQNGKMVSKTMRVTVEGNSVTCIQKEEYDRMVAQSVAEAKKRLSDSKRDPEHPYEEDEVYYPDILFAKVVFAVLKETKRTEISKSMLNGSELIDELEVPANSSSSRKK